MKDANGKLISPVAFSNLGAITTAMVPAPNQGGTEGTAATGNTSWLKVEWHYGTTAAMTTRYLDSVQFKVWIEGLDPDAKNPTQPSGKGVAIALTGSITYINIPQAKDLYGVVYVHPSTMDRYSGDRGFEDYDKKFNVHVEAYVGGVEMDAIDKNKEADPKWYTYLTPVPGLIYQMDQSPFIMADSDRYPAIKPPAPAGQ